MIGAATKFFSLPGLRLGYYTRFLNSCNIIRTSRFWRINAFADLAGQVIFEWRVYQLINSLWRTARFMLDNLRKMENLHPYPTDANFILVKLPLSTEDDLFLRLVRQGFLIRKASSFVGLNERFIQLAIKDEHSNRRFLAAVQQEI